MIVYIYHHIYIFIYSSPYTAIYVFIYIYSCVYIAHHFILLWLSPFDLSVDVEGWWFEHSVSLLQVCLSAGGAKNVSRPWLSLP